MVAEVFQSFGASTISLPGADIFPALEKGTIDAAAYPDADHLQGFHRLFDHAVYRSGHVRIVPGHHHLLLEDRLWLIRD